MKIILTLLIIGLFEGSFSCDQASQNLENGLRKQLESQNEMLQEQLELQNQRIMNLEDSLYNKLEIQNLRMQDLEELFHETMEIQNQRIMNNESKFVAFTAEGYSTGRCVPDAPAKMFNQTITNSGDHYDTANSSFTAPYDGLYFFTLTIHSSNETEIRILNIHIYNGDKRYGGPLVYFNKGMSTNSFVIYCDAGDVIWLKCKGDGELYTGGGNQNTFSGFLLSLST